MKRQLRKQQVLKRKNFLPTFVLTILLWLVTGGLIYFVDPSTLGAVPLFFIVSFFTLLFTFSLVFADRRRGLIASLGLLFFAVLKYLGVGNIINFLLIVAIGICIELYSQYQSK